MNDSKNYFSVIPNIVDSNHELIKYYNGIFVSYRYIKFYYHYNKYHYIYPNDECSFEFKFMQKFISCLKPRKASSYNVINGERNLLIINVDANKSHVLNITQTELNLIQNSISNILNGSVVFKMDYQYNRRFNAYNRIDIYGYDDYNELFKINRDGIDETIDNIWSHIKPKVFINNLNVFLNDMNRLDASIMDDTMMLEFKKMERLLKLQSLNI